jgi:hypothetical protein
MKQAAGEFLNAQRSVTATLTPTAATGTVPIATKQ